MLVTENINSVTDWYDYAHLRLRSWRSVYQYVFTRLSYIQRLWQVVSLWCQASTFSVKHDMESNDLFGLLSRDFQLAVPENCASVHVLSTGFADHCGAHEHRLTLVWHLLMSQCLLFDLWPVLWAITSVEGSSIKPNRSPSPSHWPRFINLVFKKWAWTLSLIPESAPFDCDLCPWPFRWPWLTRLLRRGRAKTLTPSLMVARRTWTWPTWAPSPGAIYRPVSGVSIHRLPLRFCLLFTYLCFSVVYVWFRVRRQ